MQETEIGPAKAEIVSTDSTKKHLRKEKVVKIRMDTIDLYELDRIREKLGFAERATIIRKLIHDFKNIDKATQIVESYKRKHEAERMFEALANG
ncbi:hypothetical protein HY989_01910 [Candidatus Micrarchaeota archaeon]|nr:hypothetical protein [Candidatus Micrarchaeota archaeon]